MTFQLLISFVSKKNSSFVPMQLSKKHIRFMQLAGFVIMLAVMVVLNNRIEKVDQGEKPHTETVSSIGLNISGVAPLSAQIPSNPEGAIPIRLISNPNSPFLVFINKSYEFRNNYRYTQCRKRFLHFCSRLQTFFITEFLVTARNKDIQ